MTEVYDLTQARQEMAEWARQIALARTHITEQDARIHELTETVKFREFQLQNANEIIDRLAAKCQQLEAALDHARRYGADSAEVIRRHEKRIRQNLEAIRRHETGEL
jgi:chromosome segregation ATPase